ncbi:signal-transduction protein with cAMP-binding, CBS, and nucleotidyltransferase domain [Wenyingzhuangia heitensis]|uniref:Signal-transduction protein with cAMP-binding, CBS, and nucleotidyltransferase domain n=1 Tax=Wenyingzhuangia heitensis TaxID=1487859 RepID=A0ABX0U6V5_9FLAO|nr:Crp/Fnr family transcriptional regulator [Wenyingzhuangia heitensis]NIJ44587.1 signal-transduction protein with cAMP-binding, CBS, and nucleotidyltransferase domain [Wenyingzhuangia heitensis]
MENTLVELMSNFINLTDDEKQGIKEAFPIKTFAKDIFLLKEGQVAKDAFLVIKGCVREYSIEDGEEVTSGFYTEFQSAVNFDSMANSKPSKYCFACTEDTIVAVMNAEKENALYKKFPRFGEVCRVEMEKMLGASQEEFLTFKKATPKERYLNLLKNRPDLINRVPQYQLASYLGVKPETLSRIRKRVSMSD